MATHAHHNPAAPFAASHKAPYRPGKAPLLKRNDSLVSLPSPPSDYDDLPTHGDDGMDVDGGLEQPPVRRAFAPAEALDEDDEVDQLDSDSDVEEEEEHIPANKSLKRPFCALGSPANLVGGHGGASRRQLLNPFLNPPPAASSSSSSAHSALDASAAYPSPTRPDSHASPTRRRRADPDRIKLASSSSSSAVVEGGVTTPPQKTRAELVSERQRQAEEEERARRLNRMGWDDPENPFVERDEGEMARRLREKKPLKRPETITLVKRGQRISTSVPFTAVLTSTSTTDDPFTFTAPKLLFPPKSPSSPPNQPTTPPKRESKFLEALRAAGASEKKPAGGAVGGELPPTPVTLKRPAPGQAAPGGGGGVAGGAARFGPYKKMRGLGAGGTHPSSDGGLR